MRRRWAWHLRRRDRRFVAVVALNLVAIAAFLATETGPPDSPAGGWRRIDRAALEARIEAGELSRTEGLWWRQVEPAKR